MRHLLKYTAPILRFITLILFALLLGLSACKDDEPVFQIDLLAKTWVYQSLESSTLDPTFIFEFDKLLKSSEITFTKDANKAGFGTYSVISPNNPDDPSGQGTWLVNSSDKISTLILDDGTADRQHFDVITLTATQLHLSTEVGSPMQYDIKYTAK